MTERVKNLNQTINDYIIENQFDNREILQNLWLFTYMATKLNELYTNFSEKTDIILLAKKSKRFSLIEKINLIKEFYNKYNINIDIDKLISDGTIDFIESIDEDNYYYNGYNSYYYRHKSVVSCNNGNILDVPILVHELGHYRNQPDDYPEQIREIFTEALARTDEFLFLDYISDFTSDEIIRKYYIYLLNMSASNAYKASEVLKMFLLFDELGDISFESYKLFYEDDNIKNYETNINVFEKEIQKEDFILEKYVYYMFDTYISTYLFFKFKENNSFLENINKLHEIVNEDNMFKCLKLIGLNDLGDEDQKKLLNSVKKMIKSIEKR